MNATSFRLITANEKMWLANAVIIGKIVCTRRLCRCFPDPTPMTKIRFDYGITVTIQRRLRSSPFANTHRVPRHARLPRCRVTALCRLNLDADFNIARGLIEKIGVGKIVHRDKMPPLATDVIV